MNLYKSKNRPVGKSEKWTMGSTMASNRTWAAVEQQRRCLEEKKNTTKERKKNEKQREMEEGGKEIGHSSLKWPPKVQERAH